MYLKDVRIDYATNWQRLHLNGIRSAYNSSAFFEYYFDSLEPFYRKKTTFLIDLNTQLTHTILNDLGIRKEFSLSAEFRKSTDSTLDYRDVIHPKKNPESNSASTPEKYMQVFSDKYNFVPNLSIMDLLFNTGPEARVILETGWKNRPF